MITPVSTELKKRYASHESLKKKTHAKVINTSSRYSKCMNFKNTINELLVKKSSVDVVIFYL